MTTPAKASFSPLGFLRAVFLRVGVLPFFLRRRW